MNDENCNPNKLPLLEVVAINKNKEQQATTTSLITVELLSKLTRSTPLNKVYRLDLDIRNQKLSPITHISGLHHVFNLKVLSLAGNVLTDLEGLNCLSHLVELNLSENNFRKLDNLEKHLSKSLVRLNLSGNQIKRIPPAISTLKRLSVLQLSRNDLEVVSDLQHLQSLHRLRQLRLEDNPFSLIEKTIPFALFCVPSLDTINGCEIMPNERKDAFQRFQHLESNDHCVSVVEAAVASADTTTTSSYTEWNTTDTLSPIGQTSNPWRHHNIHAETAFHLRMTMDGNESSVHPIRLGHASAYTAVDMKRTLPDTVMSQPMSTTGMSMEKTVNASSVGLLATTESKMRNIDASPFTPDSITHQSHRSNNNNEDDSDRSCRSLDFFDTPTIYPPVVIHHHVMDTSDNTSVVHTSSPYIADTGAGVTTTIVAEGVGRGDDNIAEAMSSSLEILDLHDRMEQLTTRLLSSETAYDNLTHTHHQLQQDLRISQSNEKHLEDIILTLQSKVDESDEQAEQVLQRLFLENQELTCRLQGFERQTKADSEVHNQLQYWQSRCGIAEGELKTIREGIGLLESAEEATTTTTVSTASTIPPSNGWVDHDVPMHKSSCADVVVIHGGNHVPCSHCSNYYEGMQNAVVLHAQTMIALETSRRRVEGLKKALSLVSLVQIPSAHVSNSKGASLTDIDEDGDGDSEEKEEEEGGKFPKGGSPLEGTMVTLQQDIVKLERSKQEIVDSIKSLHVTLASLQQQRKSFTEENELLNQQATALAVDVARLEDEKEGILARIPELLRQASVAEEERAALGQVRVEREGLDASIAVLSTEKGMLERDKGALERQLSDLRDEIVALGGERQVVEEAVRVQQEVLMRLLGEEQKLLGAVAAAEEAAGVAMSKAEQALADQNALSILHETERKSLASTREHVLRVKNELLAMEDRLRRTIDAATGEEEKLRLLSSLVIGQANNMDDTLQAVKREVEKQEQLSRDLVEQRRKREEEMVSQQRRLEHQCQMLRRDIEDKENQSQNLQKNLYRVQEEIDELLSRRQLVIDERLRSEEKLQAALSLLQIQEATKEKQEALQVVGRELLEMEETLRLWREEKATLDHELCERNERKEREQREDQERRMALSIRQKDAEEDLKQTLHRTQISATAFQELSKQLEKRQNELSQSRKLLREIESKRDEVAASTLVQSSALETLHDELGRAQYELEQAHTTLRQLHEQITIHTSKHTNIQTNVIQEIQQRDALCDEITRLRQERENLQRCEENMKASVAVTANHVETLQQELQRIRQEIEQENIILTEKRSQTVVMDKELSSMREKQTTLQLEQERALHAAIATLKEEQTIAEINKTTAVRQLRDITAEGQRTMIEHKKPLGTLDQQIAQRQAMLTEIERSVEAVGKSRREEETKLSHQQLLCRAAKEELMMLEEQTRNLRMETTTTDTRRLQSNYVLPATTTNAKSDAGDVLVRGVISTAGGDHGAVSTDISSNQPSSASLNSNNNNNNNTTAFATTDFIVTVPSTSIQTEKDMTSTTHPTFTTTIPLPPPPFREQIAKLRQQSQQILRNNHAVTGMLRPSNSSNT